MKKYIVMTKVTISLTGEFCILQSNYLLISLVASYVCKPNIDFKNLHQACKVLC